MKLFYIFLIYYVFFLSTGNLKIYAQVGINTKNPTAVLDIVTNSTNDINKIFNVKNSKGLSLFSINKKGYIDIVENSNSLVKLDLRDKSPNQFNRSLGIGYSDIDPSLVGSGVLRYNPTFKALEFSNGSNWVQLSSEKKRVFVLAENTSGSNYIVSFGSINQVLNNWTVVSDETKSFDPVSGLFTAPRDGVYRISVSAVFNNVQIRSGSISSYELSLIQLLDDYLAIDYQGAKSVVTYFGGTGSITMSNTCKKIFYLKKGESVYIAVNIINIIRSAQLSPDGASNVLTIAEI